MTVGEGTVSVAAFLRRAPLLRVRLTQAGDDKSIAAAAPSASVESSSVLREHGLLLALRSVGASGEQSNTVRESLMLLPVRRPGLPGERSSRVGTVLPAVIKIAKYCPRPMRALG